MGWFYPALGSLAVMTAAPVQVPEITGNLDNTEILALDRERYRRLTVPVSIGKHGPFDFMVDTGAQATVLSTRLADMMGLTERGAATLVGMASRREVEVVSLDDFALGTRRFTVRVAPLVEQAHIGGADGILGLDSLQRQRVLLDFEANTMAVADADSLGGNRGFDITVKARSKLGQLIITSAKIDGVNVAVILDTGAQSSLGNNALLEKLRRRREVGVATLTDVNGQQLQSNLHLTRSIRIGRAELQNIPIAFADAPPFEALGLHDKPALMLGMQELKLFKRVAIDFETRTVLFDLPNGSGPEYDWNFGGRAGRL